ncbi:hypothetical protein KC19_9G149400 [Ceratodon purpureus]|uniref:Uncharacterized protein n=1 Tax=Ceratodon purpureus TaxID=3225 RepID=A0A8T0GZZ1_CERPU|nr:hypothetical protein KC19_9G149400 [Ceratodon purpureus]
MHRFGFDRPQHLLQECRSLSPQIGLNSSEHRHRFADGCICYSPYHHFTFLCCTWTYTSELIHHHKKRFGFTIFHFDGHSSA